MGDLLSVIVPVYNVEKYLRQCIDSILQQTYKQLEIILVDDGSTDASGAICDKYQAMDRRITVIHQKNGGLSAARNAGLEIARGDWIAFVDSDDWIDTAMYQTLMSQRTEELTDLVLCKYEMVEENGQRREPLVDEECLTCVFQGRELLSAYINRVKQYNLSVAVWDRIYRKDLLGQMRFPEGRVNEDIFFTVEVFYKSKQAVYVDASLYFYRVNRKGGITAAPNSIKKIDDNITLIGQAVDFLCSKNEVKLAQRFFSGFYVDLFWLTLTEEDEEVKAYAQKYLEEKKKEIKCFEMPCRVALKGRCLTVLVKNRIRRLLRLICKTKG